MHPIGLGTRRASQVDDQMMNLLDLVPEDSGWGYLDARDINAPGQIVGSRLIVCAPPVRFRILERACRGP